MYDQAAFDALRRQVEVTGPTDVEVDVLDDDLRPTGETYRVKVLTAEVEHNGQVHNARVEVGVDAYPEVVANMRKMIVDRLAHEALSSGQDSH